MSISMSSASVPICVRMLGNLSHCMDKAQAFVDARKCESTALTQFRLGARHVAVRPAGADCL